MAGRGSHFILALPLLIADLIPSDFRAGGVHSPPLGGGEGGEVGDGLHFDRGGEGDSSLSGVASTVTIGPRRHDPSSYC